MELHCSTVILSTYKIVGRDVWWLQLGPGMGVMLSIQNRILSQPALKSTFYRSASPTGVPLSILIDENWGFIQIIHDKTVPKL